MRQTMQRQAVTRTNEIRYRRADSAGNGLILDEWCATTGWRPLPGQGGPDLSATFTLGSAAATISGRPMTRHRNDSRPMGTSRERMVLRDRDNESCAPFGMTSRGRPARSCTLVTSPTQPGAGEVRVRIRLSGVIPVTPRNVAAGWDP